MVVLSAAICNKTGKALVARQFVEVSRSRIEGLLAAFPKLIGLEQQHTFIETESVRYVYQPLEELFIVLITNKSSNILEDLETLHVFSRMIPDQCRVVNEEEVSKHAFDLIFAFDEIVTSGYRENVTPSQIRNFLEMESQEEKIQEMVARNKEQDAKEQAKLRIKQMESKGKGQGIQNAFKNPMAMGGSGGNSYSSGSARPPVVETPEERPPSYTKPSAPAKGLKLGKKQTTNDFLEAMKSEEGLVIQESNHAKPGQTQAKQSNEEAIHIIVEEKIQMVANRDGGLENMEIKGDLTLKVTDPSKSLIKVLVSQDDKKPVQFKTHPNVDKKVWTTDSCIMLKDPSRPFPIGQPLGVLKWRIQEKDESAIPLTINCWPNPTGDGNVEVNIEYELVRTDLELTDVVIQIPVSSQPIIASVDGEYNYIKSKNILEWTLPVVDAEASSGTMEFTCKGNDGGVFFPVSASFSSNSSFCGVKAVAIKSLSDNSNVVFSQDVFCTTEEYSIV